MRRLIYGSQKYKSKKLTATFNRRIRYVCHAKNLQFYIQQGLKIVEIHRVLTFKQDDFLKRYIDFCTLKRSQSVSKFGQKIYKVCYQTLTLYARNRAYQL